MESVCKLLEERGHDVTRCKDVLPVGSPDPLVAKEAQERAAILVSQDQDFTKLVIPNRKGARFKKLSKINLKCKNTDPVKRLAAAMSLIEFEYDLAQHSKIKRIMIDVQANLIRTLR